MKPNQRIVISKRMLREGLMRLLQIKELDKIRVNELCEESGINRTTFYRYYDAPRDVLVELGQEFAEKMIPARPPVSRDEAMDMLENACTYIHENADTAKVLFSCNTTEDLQQSMSPVISRFWESQKDSYPFDPGDKTTAQLGAMFMGGGCYMLLREWIMHDIPKTPQEITGIISRIIQWPENREA